MHKEKIGMTVLNVAVQNKDKKWIIVSEIYRDCPMKHSKIDGVIEFSFH